MMLGSALAASVSAQPPGPSPGMPPAPPGMPPAPPGLSPSQSGMPPAQPGMSPGAPGASGVVPPVTPPPGPAAKPEVRPTGIAATVGVQPIPEVVVYRALRQFPEAHKEMACKVILSHL